MSGTAFDPFEALGVATTADEAEVARAFRRIAKTCHPDVADGPEARARFAEISRARDELSDPVRRVEAQEARARRGPKGHRFEAFDGFFDDVARHGRGSDIRRERPRRGADAAREVTVTLEEAFRGGGRTLPGVPGPCRPCDGTGRVATDEPAPCPGCGGAGRTRRGRGIITVEVACPDCGGSGKVDHAVCPAWAGSRQEPGAGASYVLPRGVEDGCEIRLQGLGGPGSAGGPPGDLVLTVRVAPHRAYARRGADLAMRLRVPVWEAALGAERRWRGVDGQEVALSLRPGTLGGSRLEVPGAGMPSGSGRGRLVVTVEVAVPDASAGEMREAFERVRALAGGA